MNDFPGNAPARNHKALELTLHDGLDRLEEFALMLAFQGSGSQFEILSIAPPAAPAEAVTPHLSRSNENVVCLRQALLRKTA